MNVWADKTPEQILADVNQALNETWQAFYGGIYVTYIVPPAQGWPIAVYCPICKVTSFLYCAYGKKPDDADYFQVRTCVDDLHHALQL